MNSHSMIYEKGDQYNNNVENSKQWLQILATISAAFLAIGSGIQMGWPSPSLLKLKEEGLGFTVSEEESSYIVMIAPLGYLIGCPLTGFLQDTIGRKYTLLTLSLPQMTGWILIATSTRVEMLYVARFLTGVADGGLYTILPIYIGEIVEPKIRGALATAHSLGVSLGIIFINSYGSYLPIRTSAYISLVPEIMFLVTFIWMPESPYFFLMKNEHIKATDSLRALRRMKNVEKELCKIMLNVERQLSEPGRYRDIFLIRSNLKAFLILMGLRTFQQMSGLSPLRFYNQILFKEAEGFLSPQESSIVCYSIPLMFTLIGSVLLDRFGRKPLFLFSSVATAVTLISIAIYFSLEEIGYNMSAFYWLPTVGIMVYNVVNTVGLMLVPNIMSGEILSICIKSKAIGIVNIYFGALVSFCSKLFQLLTTNVGMYMPFYIFGCCCFVSAVFSWFYLPETKGKTLEEIQQMLKGNEESKLSENEKGEMKN